MNQSHYIERPPRLQPELPRGEVEIPPPPAEENNPNQPLIQLALPLLTIIGYVLMAALGQGRNLLLMLPMGLSVIMSIAIALYTRHRNSQKKFEIQAAYTNLLSELRQEMSASQEVQRRFYHHNAPGVSEAFQIAALAQQSAVNGRDGGHARVRLWERRTGDPDFGNLRLGIGALPSTVVYKLKEGGNFNNPLVREANRLASDSTYVGDVPITISLRPVAETETSPRHAIGVAGKSANDAYSFVWAVLAHYTAFHAPSDARLLILGLDEARPNWRWVGRLPHCAAANPNDTLCFENASDRDGPKEQSKVNSFLRRLRLTLEERRLRLEDSDNSIDVTLPHLLVVVDLLSPLPEGSGLRNLEMDPAISLLVHEGPRLGASIIFLVQDSSKVPGGCKGVVELVDSTPLDGNPGSLGFRYAEVGVNTARFAGRADIVKDSQELTNFAQQLSMLSVRRSYGADLPRSVDILDMLGVQREGELGDKMLASWQRSQQPEAAEWLKAPLGVLSGGDIRRLTFSADADGVHGLIAGSTGSGKSELLMTMILSLAYNYDPSIVNFVLVDFKGGAAFEPFRNLPHCVDIVTNLHGNAVERMFAAIIAEIHRREAINVATGSKHIVHYRKNGLHLPPYGKEVSIKGETLHTAPYPHLFVFIDEFAEMIAENPEYRAQLNSITRLGRALGITLILAAQRPTGVTDQMRANIKFRIALRVETREESGEVLRRPDAAYLPTGIPGRGYLQVGNENIELIQVAWSGAEFQGDQSEEKPPIIWHDRPSRRRVVGSGDDLPKVFEVMVNTMAEQARQHSLPQRKPWPDFLPDTLSLESQVDTGYINPENLAPILANLPDRSGEQQPVVLPLNATVTSWLTGHGKWSGVDWEAQAMRAVVGLVDNPYHAEQFPLLVDLRRGHAVVFGASGWGKTTFLRTLLTALVVTHSPRELHTYILDFGGRQLSVFRDLPHLGALITPDEEERVVRLLRKLDHLLERRKALLSDAGADDLYSYNRASPRRALPAVLVVIDNFAEFREAFDPLMPLLTSIARESRAYGIHFAVSAESPSALSGKLYGLFTERFALKLSDPGDYLDIVGRGARAVEDIAGRGYVRVGRQALAFQAALPVGGLAGEAVADETQKLAQLVRLMHEMPFQLDELQTPEPVLTLATRVLLANLLAGANGKPGKGARPALGIDDRSLEAWRFDARSDGPHMLVIGPPGSGKTTMLRSLALALAHSYPPEQVALVLVDFQQRFFRYGGQFTLSDLPHVLAVLSRAEELEAFVESLKAEAENLAGKERSIFVLIDNYDTFADEARLSRTALPNLGVLARERGTDGLHFVIAGSPDTARSPDDLRRQVTMPRLGLALESAELVSTLNGRVPRGMAEMELPMGRGFVVKAGQTSMVQLATPYDDDERPEASLDAWVQRIQAQYPNRKATWHSQEGAQAEADRTPAEVVSVEPGDKPKEAPADQKPNAEVGDQKLKAASDDGRSKAAPGGQKPKVASAGSAGQDRLPQDLDVEALKPKLLEMGLAPPLLAMLSPVDIVNLAIEMKLITLEK